ncbi:hypothetical protein BRADI_1g03330v3 [Brachypodium distachyon]|uniref:ELM2 domain-containing protein n=1 Tax=Brachypodium distachyon TaxID=15368 RepID=A0A2K2DHW8_BRADI|nr:hypothetical protein BRADI_1g03330v3 [Brachypodium distachyon]
MAGSDLPSGNGGPYPPPPTTPPRGRAKHKRGDDDASVPTPGTRSSASASARQDVEEVVNGAVRVARRAAAGALWTPAKKAATVPGLDGNHVELMRDVICEARQALSVVLPDDADSLYQKKYKVHRSGSRSSGRLACKISYLSSFPAKRVGRDPVAHQASVPEWKGAPSEKYTDDYKAKTLQKMGTIVCPLSMDISAADEAEKTRKERVDKCDCSLPGSDDCVRVHVKKARSFIKDQLGEEAFKNCGLDAMGEQVGELWTATDKRKLANVDKLIPQNKHQKFMKIALQQLKQKEAKDLGKYYYNVFLPRRLASLTREEPGKGKDVDTNDEESDQDDGNNEHQSRKKSKNFRSSSERRILSLLPC